MKLKLIVAALVSMFVMVAAMPSVAATVNFDTDGLAMHQQDPKERKVKGKKKKAVKQNENSEKPKGDNASEQGQANRKAKGK